MTQKVLQLPEYQKASAISVFLSMPGREVSTSAIVIDALRQGKKVFIPYIHPEINSGKSKIMDMLRLKDESDQQSLKPDAWGIPSLSAEGIEERENALGGRGISDAGHRGHPSVELDLIFMPGMAFDSANNRLGHGKGFYDRYLSRIREYVGRGEAPPRFPVLSRSTFASQNQQYVLTVLKLLWLFASNFSRRQSRFLRRTTTGK